ncbi:MAG: LAGLIDADG family homing endonuclease [Candidatus Omnitrophica bacterium]|nr:LAGLIDADG family homing endonuclease [Candidatus Omnitrophota bacterium]MDD5551107.1 LAGLIDADG family homing endonuclease [Candidatus Omnitrophota bacterium]
MKRDNSLKRKEIDVDKFLETAGFEPHEGQKPIIDAYVRGDREIVWVSGRRSGKTLVNSCIVAMETMIPGSKIWICFDKDTDIMVPNGVKKISDIKNGDIVYSHIGKERKVYDTMKRWYNGDVYRLSVYGGKDIIVTPEHPFLSIINNYKSPLSWSRRKGLFNKPEFIEIKNLKEKDYICFPKIQKEFKNGNELDWLFGLFMAEGDCEKYRVNFSLHIDEIRFAVKIEKIVKEHFDAKTTIRIIEKNNCLSVRVSSKKFVDWIKDKYEGIAKGGTKKLSKKGFEFANNGYIEFIRGVIDGDGHIDKDTEIEITQSSEEFINQLWLLSRINGFTSKVSLQERKGGFKIGSIVWRLRFGGDSKRILDINHISKKSTFEERSDYSLLQIRKIEKIHYNNYVYNISVEKDNSYLTMCGAVHNCAPDYGLTEKVFNYLIQYIAKIYPPKTYRVGSRPGMSIRLDNGSIVECKSADNPTSLLGEELDLLIIDEAAMMSPNIYDRYLFATTAMRKGTTIFISTPFRKNWFFRKYKEVEETGDGFVFRSPSAINPYMPKEEIERAKRSLPEDIFKQEYLAEFLDTGAGVFRGFYDVVNDDCYEDPKPDHKYVIGADLAKVNDFTVLTAIDRQTHKVVSWDRFNRVDWNLIEERIVALAKKYNNARVIVDSTGLGSPITERLKRSGISVDDFKFSNKSKKDLIDKEAIFIENKAVFIPNEPILLDELDCFACEMSETTGTVKYSAPRGRFDDCVISLGLAIWGLYDLKLSKPIPQPIKDITPKELIRRKFRRPTR